MESLYLTLAIMIIFFSQVQSQETTATINETINNTSLSMNSEPLADIEVTSEVYERDIDTVAVFAPRSIEPAKQEIYNVTVANKGEVPLHDVIVVIEAIEGMIFKNSAEYDASGDLRLECFRSDLCDRASTSIMKNLGSLESNETKSILINAYIKPQIEKGKINIKVAGTKPNGTVSDIRGIAEFAKCVFVDNIGRSCTEQVEGCTCIRPNWANAFSIADLSTKPLIDLGQIDVTNTISAIKTADREWYPPKNIESYTPNIADQVIYQISVSNTDRVNSLIDIKIIDQLPGDMNYLSSSMTEDEITSHQILPINVSDNTITWRLDEIKPTEKVLINLVAVFLNNDPRRFENRVHAIGTWDTKHAFIKDESQVVSSAIPA